MLHGFLIVNFLPGSSHHRNTSEADHLRNIEVDELYGDDQESQQRIEAEQAKRQLSQTKAQIGYNYDEQGGNGGSFSNQRRQQQQQQKQQNDNEDEDGGRQIFISF